jgi:hypothetical protein
MMSAQYIRTQLPRASCRCRKVRKPRRFCFRSPLPLPFAFLPPPLCPLPLALALPVCGWGVWVSVWITLWMVRNILVGGLPRGEVGFFEVGSWTSESFPQAVDCVVGWTRKNHP